MFFFVLNILRVSRYPLGTGIGHLHQTHTHTHTPDYHQLIQPSVQHSEKPTISVAANLFQQLVYKNKDGLSAGIICAGWDKYKGGQVYSIPLGGGVMRQPFAIGGSGSTYIYGYCDSTYKDGMTKAECLNFVKNCASTLFLFCGVIFGWSCTIWFYSGDVTLVPSLNSPPAAPHPHSQPPTSSTNPTPTQQSHWQCLATDPRVEQFAWPSSPKMKLRGTLSLVISCRPFGRASQSCLFFEITTSLSLYPPHSPPCMILVKAFQ